MEKSLVSVFNQIFFYSDREFEAIYMYVGGSELKRQYRFNSHSRRCSAEPVPGRCKRALPIMSAKPGTQVDIAHARVRSVTPNQQLAIIRRFVVKL